MAQALVQYFRCAETDIQFVPLAQDSGEPGYFRFGPDATCYGQVGVGFTAEDVDSELNDVFAQVQVQDGICQLPFDPTKVIENLRRERYVAQDHVIGKNSLGVLLRRSYYSFRPLFPVWVRKHLQRISLKGWDKRLFPSWPVDRSVDKILQRLLMLAMESRGLTEIPFIWFWPEGKSTCVIMTHDVETKTGLDFCPSLMDLDDSYGIKSSFQIIPHRRYRTPQLLLNEIQRRRFEVNVHDWNHDGLLFARRDIFLQRAAQINQAAAKFGAQGFRSGALYRNPEWFDAFTFSYDMSVPNVGHLDAQVGGCCTVMPYFIGTILELPVTTTQDYTLFHILRDYSLNLWNQQINLILQGNGLVSFIVHPDYIIERRARATYSQLLLYLSTFGRDQNAWLALPHEVNRWWRARSQMRLIQESGRWRIEGPEKERARVSYAARDGEKLIWRIEHQPADRTEAQQETRRRSMQPDSPLRRAVS